MASIEIYEFDCTIPLNTAKASPVTVALTMPARTVDRIRIKVPPGPNGSIGFALGSSGQNIIPKGQGTFIVTSDEVLDWDMTGMIETGAWQFYGFNTGIYDHTVYVRFAVSLLAQPSASINSTLIPQTVLSAPASPGSAPGGSGTGDATIDGGI